MPLPQTVEPNGSQTVLLVDADPETRKLAAFMLERQGYTTIEARNRAEALCVVDRPGQEVNLLLIDVRGRGRELAENIKQCRPDLRVLFLCGDMGAAAKFLTDHGISFLKKPFTMAEIAGKVRETMERPSGRTMTASG